jgi:nuclear inhibitor of protein phosphatase 1
MTDFIIPHVSCSRLHAALTYHKHLNISYLTDLGSTHGTFVGALKIEPNKPTVVNIGTSFHFGFSTREYVLREKVEVGEEVKCDNSQDLANLTEFNTAYNKKLVIPRPNDTEINKRMKRKSVQFNDDEAVINPEDVDPYVGRFQNLVQSTIIPATKRLCIDASSTLKQTNHAVPQINPAPEIQEETIDAERISQEIETILAPLKKTYAKESWPKRRALIATAANGKH